MTRRPTLLLTLAALATIAACGTAASRDPDPEWSTIEANVPKRAVFDQTLRRDLTTYFKSTDQPAATSVEWTLLRKQPTQAGAAYPKFYAWVRVMNGDAPLEQGAVRMEAIDGKRFDVRDFVSAAQVNENPDALRRVFPSPLVKDIVDRAAAAR